MWEMVKKYFKHQLMILETLNSQIPHSLNSTRCESEMRTEFGFDLMPVFIEKLLSPNSSALNKNALMILNLCALAILLGTKVEKII